MSDALEFQCIYAPQTHIINTSFEKQQPASKLVNRYLSTAAQYLNRTKSFHVSSTPSNNQQNDTHQESTSSANVLTDNLGQSLHNISPSTPTMSSLERNLSPAMLPLNSNQNKSQGFVNTLRRSLRKNKERFYNKRAATMKSCHALNAPEQTNEDQDEIPSKISMTPTLFGRRQHRSNKMENYSSLRYSNKDQMRKT